jgi:hypothetical protein
MVRHILILQPHATSTPEDFEACRGMLAACVGQVPGLIDFHWGENVGPEHRRDGFTYGFTMDFVDRASLDAYGPHPVHTVAAAKVRATFRADRGVRLRALRSVLGRWVDGRSQVTLWRWTHTSVR